MAAELALRRCWFRAEVPLSMVDQLHGLFDLPAAVTSTACMRHVSTCTAAVCAAAAFRKRMNTAMVGRVFRNGTMGRRRTPRQLDPGRCDHLLWACSTVTHASCMIYLQTSERSSHSAEEQSSARSRKSACAHQIVVIKLSTYRHNQGVHIYACMVE